MSPLDAATMQVMTTESVILPPKPLLGASTANPPPAILNPLCEESPHWFQAAGLLGYIASSA